MFLDLSQYASWSSGLRALTPGTAYPYIRTRENHPPKLFASGRKQGRAGLFPMKASQASTSKQGFSAGLDTTGTDFPIGTTIVVDDIQGGAIRVSS